MQPRTVPGRPELVGCDRHRRKRGRGLGLQEAEALGELARDEVAQRHVVHQHHETDALCGIRGRCAERHIVGHHRDLGLQVEAPLRVPQRDPCLWGEERIGAALVHERVRPERGRQLCATRSAHELHMVDIGRAVHPLVGPGQRRDAVGGAEGLAFAGVEAGAEDVQERCDDRPVIERGLQGRCRGRRREHPLEVARYDDEPSVTTARKTRQLHGAGPLRSVSFDFTSIDAAPCRNAV